MKSASRPLRAIGVILGGWTIARVAAYWPVAAVTVEPPDRIGVPMAKAPTIMSPLGATIAQLSSPSPAIETSNARSQSPSTTGVATMRAAASPVMPAIDPAEAITEPDRAPRSIPKRTSDVDMSIIPGLPVGPVVSRWSGSAWALMRGNDARSQAVAGLASGGQLGGSQAGVRLFYTPRGKAYAITARVSAPLGQRTGREAAIGVALRGRYAGLIAEQRFALDSAGRNAPSIFAYGGVSDIILGRGLKFDGYAQSGIVGINRPAAFLDGAARVERDMLSTTRASLAVGAGLWGGAQPGAARIDIGPQIVARVPVAAKAVRITAEWRQRVAGDAAPASGPAVTVGFDF